MATVSHNIILGAKDRVLEKNYGSVRVEIKLEILRSMEMEKVFVRDTSGKIIIMENIQNF